jgi:hypothetical protein
MRIEPAQFASASNAVNSRESSAPDPAPHPAARRSTGSSGEAKAGTVPETEIPAPRQNYALSLPSENEVDVQYENGGRQLVFELRDKQSGELVLEIPSKQVRSVAQAIEERFRQAAARRQSAQVAAAVKSGGEGHDNFA